MNNWLVKMRTSKKMTQDEVRTTYSSIEQGRRRPSVENAMRIASALEFDWTIFFEKERRELTRKGVTK